AEDRGFPERVVPVKVRTMAPFPLRAVDTDSASVRVSPTSRQGSRLAAIGEYVATDQSRGRAQYFDNRVNCGTPSAHTAHWRHDPWSFGPVCSCQCLRHQ